MSSLELILRNCLSEIHNEFQTDELAYLALTSKIEMPFRDRLAFALHRKLESKDLCVCREWKRTDIAILDRDKPVAMIEIKAFYTANAAIFPEDIHGYWGLMERDVEKCSKHAEPDTQIFTLLLATHPQSQAPDKFKDGMKYHALIKRAFKRFNNHQSILKNATTAMEDAPRLLRQVNHGEISAGRAFGIQSRLLHWLYQGQINL